MKCKDCRYFVPCGDKGLCYNPRNHEGCFFKRVKPDDTIGHDLYCFEEKD